MISLQTNTNSLVAQQNLNRAFQSKTIQQLTSGYRINSSSDDKAHILQQSSIAAMSQANSASQAVLRLLQ